MTDPTVAERLRRRVRRLLVARHRKQRELAAVLDLSQADVSKRIRGYVPFRVDELDALAAFFGITVAELFFDEFGRFDRRKGGDRRQRGDRRKINLYALPYVAPRAWEPPGYVRQPPALPAHTPPDQDEQDDDEPETRPA